MRTYGWKATWKSRGDGSLRKEEGSGFKSTKEAENNALRYWSDIKAEYHPGVITLNSETKPDKE